MPGMPPGPPGHPGMPGMPPHMMPPRPGIILFLFYAIMSREIFQNFTKKISNVIETSFVF